MNQNPAADPAPVETAEQSAADFIEHLQAGSLPLAEERLQDMFAALDRATDGLASHALALHRAHRLVRRAARLALVRPDAAARSLECARKMLRATMPALEEGTGDDAAGEIGRAIEKAIAASLAARSSTLPAAEQVTG